MCNKKTIFKFEVISTIIIMISGVLLHFTYEWSGNNNIVGLVTPVNESVWEHLKLLFFPMLILLIIGYYYVGKKYENYLCAKTLGIIVSMIFIVIFFYTYLGVVGKNIDFINIGSFFVAVILGQYISYRNIFSVKFCNSKTAIIYLIVMIILFMLFSFNPPDIGLFRVPKM